MNPREAKRERLLAAVAFVLGLLLALSQSRVPDAAAFQNRMSLNSGSALSPLPS